MEEVRKYDFGKVRHDLLPVLALREMSLVLGYGAEKYGDHNWRGGMRWSRMYSACLRHLFSWHGGESRDIESGLLHLGHAGCCILFLLEYELLGLGEDDRYIIGGE